jgi:hypothetical protein
MQCMHALGLHTLGMRACAGMFWACMHVPGRHACRQAGRQACRQASMQLRLIRHCAVVVLGGAWCNQAVAA